MASGQLAPSSSVDNPGKLLKALQELISPEDILEAACRLGAVKRQRKVDITALVASTVLALIPVQGAQTTAFANYIALTGQSLAPSAFYDRFSVEFGQLMREVALRAVEGLRRVAPADRCLADFGVLLKEFSDVQVADSTCHVLQRLASDWSPSTSPERPAGIKWHTVISLRDALPVADALTPQRTHDNRALPEGALTAGTLTLFDLGYLDVERFIDAIERGAHFLTRLKSNHNPTILRVHVGKGERVKARGMRLHDALTQEVLVEEKGALDLDVLLEKGGRRAVIRAVAVRSSDGEWHWYLTTVSREVLNPLGVSDAYRLRWNVELVFKQMKSGLGLKTILASRPGAVTALVYAKITALCLARMLEIAIEQRAGRYATTQLALVLALTRCAPLLMSAFFMARGVTLQQLEERLLLIAEITARSRNRRRERAKRKREQALGATT